MQFQSGTRSRRRVKVEGGIDPDRYPHTLQFYSLPPIEIISLQEFEGFALERVKVLKAVETVGIKHVRGSNDWKDGIKKELQSLASNGTMKGFRKNWSKEKQLDDEDYADRRKDHISHFILRLAYCQSEELRRWFIQQELDLFRYRFGNELRASIERFLSLNKLNYTPISDSEKFEVQEKLAATSNTMTSQIVEGTDFYKVPFTEALDLVRNRRVYLQQGYSYVPHGDLVVIILSVFRSNLSHALAVTARAVPHMEEDGRLEPMLKNLSKTYVGQDYTNKKPAAGVITADMIDAMSKKYFPPCMQQLHTSLRQMHHLRHWGRQQYGLFLKGIGLPLEEAMRFWRAEFCKAVDPDKFDKQYSYNIRHNYGKEGKRADYTPYSCVKIITSNAPAIGDYHGCPFKHTDTDLLRQKLATHGLSKDELDEIIGKVKETHYQVGCGKFMQYSHRMEHELDSPAHPNHYFDMCYKHYNVEKPDNSQVRTPILVKSQPMRSTQSQSAASQNTSQGAPQDDFDDDLMTAEDMDMAMQGVEQCT